MIHNEDFTHHRLRCACDTSATAQTKKELSLLDHAQDSIRPKHRAGAPSAIVGHNTQTLVTSLPSCLVSMILLRLPNQFRSRSAEFNMKFKRVGYGVHKTLSDFKSYESAG